MYLFFIIITDKRTWYMYADNEGSFQQWKTKLIANGALWQEGWLRIFITNIHMYIHFVSNIYFLEGNST